MSLCPFAHISTPPQCQKSNEECYDIPTPSLQEYESALKNLDVTSVMVDISKLLEDSQACWPSDEFNGKSSYGPLFIRLAWHCSGSYRSTDGKGGCGGGRQRFWPESSWEENANLDKARALLGPIKDKYGIGLSWGDLFILAGSASILNMDGPMNEICIGRIDDSNGLNSLPLGPSPEAKYKCGDQKNNCSSPIGAEEIGLIYVNPEGFMGIPDPIKSAHQIRTIFSRMDMNDRETVALIGGGHAFGKCHGACFMESAGEAPHENPFNPWDGKCNGDGKGVNTVTSGFEGAWTHNPLKWDNEFFKLLVNDEYIKTIGPGGKIQWQNQNDPRMWMLTADIALYADTKYNKIVHEFASNINSLNEVFAASWKKLTENGGKTQWAKNKRCIKYNNLL